MLCHISSGSSSGPAFGVNSAGYNTVHPCMPVLCASMLLICPAIEWFTPLELTRMHSAICAEAGRQGRGAQGVLHAGSVTRTGRTVGADHAGTSVVGARSEILSQNACAHARESGGVICDPCQVVEQSVRQTANTFRAETHPSEFIGAISHHLPWDHWHITISYKPPRGYSTPHPLCIANLLAVEFTAARQTCCGSC